MKVSDFERSGIQLFVTEKGGLKYSAPKGWVTPEILDQLRQNKTTLIEELLSQIHPKVTGVTDQPKLVKGITNRNISKNLHFFII